MPAMVHHRFDLFQNLVGKPWLDAQDDHFGLGDSLAVVCHHVGSLLLEDCQLLLVWIGQPKIGGGDVART